MTQSFSQTSLGADQLKASLDLTLTPPRRKIVEELVAEVSNIQQLLEKEETRMYSTSMLLIIEGDPEALERAKELKTEQEMRILEKARLAETVFEGDETFILQEADVDDDDDDDDDDDIDEDVSLTCSASLIDFAHAAFTPNLGPDENMLRGVRNVRVILDSLLRQP